MNQQPFFLYPASHVVRAVQTASDVQGRRIVHATIHVHKKCTWLSPPQRTYVMHQPCNFTRRFSLQKLLTLAFGQYGPGRDNWGVERRAIILVADTELLIEPGCSDVR